MVAAKPGRRDLPPVRGRGGPRAAVLFLSPMRRHPIAIVALTAAALVLRLLRLDATEPWLDEACSAWYAGLPPADLMAALAVENHPPLYYLLLKAVLDLFGTSTGTLRALSVVAGTAWVPAAWAVGRRWLGPGAALAGAAAIAIHPLAIHHAVDARPYVLAPLLVLLALDRWGAWLADRRGRDLAGWVALAAAAFLTHHFAGPAALAPALVAWACAPGVRRGRDLGWLALPAAAVALPFLPFVLGRLGGPSLDWIGRYWHGPWDALATTGATFAGTGPHPAWLGALAFARLPDPWPPAGVALAWGLVALGVADRARHGARDAAPAWALLAVPILFPLAISLALRPAYLAGRYEVYALPAMCLAAGAGIAPVARGLRWPGGIAGAAWGALLLATVAAWVPSAFQQPNRTFHELLAREPRAVDAVIAVGYAWAPFAFHERAAPTGVPVTAVPGPLAGHPGWWDFDTPVTPDALAPVPPGDGDVWLLAMHGDGFEAWRDAQAARIAATGRVPGRPVRFGDTVLRVFSRPAADPEAPTPDRAPPPGP